MKVQESRWHSRSERPSTLLFILFSLVGVILILAAALLHFEKYHTVAVDFTRELGVVLLTACGVSLTYEIFVAERHFSKFIQILGEQIQRGETNASVCERLGVLRIFSKREELRSYASLKEIVSGLTPTSRLRMVGRSLFIAATTGEAEPIKEALRKGSLVELCCYDPEGDSEFLRDAAGLTRQDIDATLARLSRLKPWLMSEEGERPPGSLEVKFHTLDLADSYFSFPFKGESRAVWDLSFSADPDEKRILLLDSKRPLGTDLEGRYDCVYRSATIKFRYVNGSIDLDELP